MGPFYFLLKFPLISSVSYKKVFLYGFYRIQRIKLGRTDNLFNLFNP